MMILATGAGFPCVNTHYRIFYNTRRCEAKVKDDRQW